jgi:hypothetical protein
MHLNNLLARRFTPQSSTAVRCSAAQGSVDWTMHCCDPQGTAHFACYSCSSSFKWPLASLPAFAHVLAWECLTCGCGYCRTLVTVARRRSLLMTRQPQLLQLTYAGQRTRGRTAHDRTAALVSAGCQCQLYHHPKAASMPSMPTLPDVP